jgi:RNA polymerase sigma factor (sigma-70 family)
MSASSNWHGIDLQWAYGSLLRAVVRRTQCAHRAKDVLHDAFVRFALKPGTTELLAPPAYFRTVVQSVLADQHRDAQRLPLLADEPGATDDAHDDDARAFSSGLYHPSAQDLFAIRQRLDLFQRLLDALPPKCRDVFWLFRIEGHSQPEIAARLGISLNMVERHIMRALVDLRAARDVLSG